MIIGVEGAVAQRGIANIRENRIYFDPRANYDHLGKLESKEETLTYFISDEQDRRASAQLIIVVQGVDSSQVYDFWWGSGEPFVRP